MNALRPLAVGLALTFAACGGVSYHLDRNVPAPATVAVLPMQGPAPAGLRDAARQLLQSRLVARGYRVPELAWTDRVLSEHGWLRDPERFQLDAGKLGEMLTALHADAALVGDGFDESSFNVFVLRRHAVGGRVALRNADGREYWSSDHGASTFGGFLLTSGQVFAELRAQGEHGTPMASLALIDEFVEDVVGTLPTRELQPPPGAPPALTEVTSWRAAKGADVVRVRVEAKAPAGATLRFDLAPFAVGVPMVAQTDDAGRFHGEYEMPADVVVPRILVHARDAFGRETAMEVAP